MLLWQTFVSCAFASAHSKLDLSQVWVINMFCKEEMKDGMERKERKEQSHLSTILTPIPLTHGQQSTGHDIA